MSGLAMVVDKGEPILGVVPRRRGLGAALALCSLICLPCPPWLSHPEPGDDWQPRSDRQPRKHGVQARAPGAMRWRAGRRVAGQQRACG